MLKLAWMFSAQDELCVGGNWRAQRKPTQLDWVTINPIASSASVMSPTPAEKSL